MPLKILLADDSLATQKMAEKILAGAGHTVVTVSNGAAAWKKISASKPDVAVLDVFMPGYSGLEICEKIKAAPELASTSVLLTVGKMEAFDEDEAKRVNADGVLIKPFEASDLEAAIQKIEEQLSAPPPAPAAPPAPVAEIQDASYEEWKVAADEPEEEAAAKNGEFEVPSDMASAPAFGMDMLGEAPPAAPPARSTQEITSPPPPARSTQEITSPSSPARITRALEMTGGPAAFPEPPELEPPVGPSVFPSPVPDSEVEFTSAPQAADVSAAAAPELEPTARPGEDAGASAFAQDSALVTDASEMASAFPTRFGVEGADEVSVGVAADVPGLYADEQPPAWIAEEAPVTKKESSLSLEQELQKAFAASPADEAPAAEISFAQPETAAAEAAPLPEQDLAAAMAAAIGAVAPASGSTLDEEAIDRIIARISERLRPMLVEEISHELASRADRR